MSRETKAKIYYDTLKKGDDDYLRLVAEYLAMADQAKHVLRSKGYGWTGLDLLETVKLVPESDE